MKPILFILLGYLLHIGVYEVISLLQIADYDICLTKAYKAGPKSPYQQCRHHLEYSAVESILLWSPDLWKNYGNRRNSKLNLLGPNEEQDAYNYASSIKQQDDTLDKMELEIASIRARGEL